VTLFAGASGTAGFGAGDYLQSTDPNVQVNSPAGLFFANGHLYIADNSNNGVRIIF
jgi:hypothetical protein